MPVAARIRELRESKGLSQRALADGAGVSPATLSLIEQGQNSPSVATLEKLAYGLQEPVARFFTDAGDAPDVEILDLEKRAVFSLQEQSELIPLAAQNNKSSFEPLLICLKPGGRFGKKPYFVGVESAFAWVLSGTAVLQYDDREIKLGKNRPVYYDPRKPHNWSNPNKKRCELLMVRQR